MKFGIVHLVLVYLFLFLPVVGGTFLLTVWRWRAVQVLEISVFFAFAASVWQFLLHAAGRTHGHPYDWKFVVAGILCGVFGGLLGLLVRHFNTGRGQELPPRDGSAVKKPKGKSPPTGSIEGPPGCFS